MRLPEPPYLDPAHHRTLLDIATSAIRGALATGVHVVPDPSACHADLRAESATFVTLERDSTLLGCIGTLEARRPLAVDVAHHALGAAFSDPRMPAVTERDFVEMSIKISVLSPAEPMTASSFVEVADAVRPGVDGLILDAPGRRSTLLPSVWPKVAEVDEFLYVLWRKAGVEPGTWPRGTRVSRYATEEFGDPGPRTL
ncbi:MAG: AmmeMemoRadiSam system protein A [Acidimicrobiia bacterium]|nr:AmmeMemoRadiSam system protein A [Acidimicrobiia bacterium]